MLLQFWVIWTIAKLTKHAKSCELFNAAAEQNNPDVICPVLIPTESQKEELEMVRTNTSIRISKARVEFCSGTMDPNDDDMWASYLAELDAMGLQYVIAQDQAIYERSK